MLLVLHDSGSRQIWENPKDVMDDVVTLSSFVVTALCSLLGTGVASLKFVDGGYPGELPGYIGDTAAARTYCIQRLHALFEQNYEHTYRHTGASQRIPHPEDGPTLASAIAHKAGHVSQHASLSELSRAHEDVSGRLGGAIAFSHTKRFAVRITAARRLTPTIIAQTNRLRGLRCRPCYDVRDSRG